MRQRIDHRALDLRHVGGDPAGEFPDATLAEERHRQGDEPAVTVATQIGEGTLTDAVEGQRAIERGERLQGDRTREQEGHLVEAEGAEPGNRGPARMQRRVDQRPGEEGKREPQGGADEQRGESGEEPRAVRADIAGERQALTQGLAVERSLGQAVEGDVFL